MNDEDEVYFEIISKLNREIRTTKRYWQKIISKHPPIETLVNETKETLKRPDEIRTSRKDESVFLYYKYYADFILCVLFRHTNGE